MMTLEQIAAAAHEMNRLWCCSVGDFSNPNWLNAPDWQKQSAIAGVAQIIANPLLTPEQSHEGWMEFKRRDGWVHGVSKDPSLRTHPCMVPYGELPPHQRAKDLIFTLLVKAIIAANQMVAAEEMA